jgi:hypothetical protein
MYERPCEFKDKAVEALSEEVNVFCHQVLKDISQNSDVKNRQLDSCAHDENDAFSKQKNEQLIEHFEQTLCLYE